MAHIQTGLSLPVPTEFTDDALALSSAIPGAIHQEGGESFYVIGTFKNLPCQVFIVHNGEDLPCYSGQRGNGYNPRPLAGNILRAVTPPISGSPVDLAVKVVQDGNTETLVAALDVQTRVWHQKVFNMRQLWPPKWRTGIRNLETTDLILTPLQFELIQDQVAFADNAFSFTPGVLNPLNRALTFSSVGTALPGWATLNTTTGAITGSPTGGDVGSAVGVQLQVTDGLTTDTSAEFTLFVNPEIATMAPVLSSAFSETPTLNGFTAPLTLVGDGLADGLAFNPTTGNVSGTLTQDGLLDSVLDTASRLIRDADGRETHAFDISPEGVVVTMPVHYYSHDDADITAGVVDDLASTIDVVPLTGAGTINESQDGVDGQAVQIAGGALHAVDNVNLNGAGYDDQSYSVMATFRVDAPVGATQALYARHAYATEVSYWQLQYDANAQITWVTVVQTEASLCGVGVGDLSVIGGFHRAIGIHDRGDQVTKMFVDGVKSPEDDNSNQNQPMNFQNTGQSPSMGARQTSYPASTAGHYAGDPADITKDEYAFWNAVLTDDEAISLEWLLRIEKSLRTFLQEKSAWTGD